MLSNSTSSTIEHTRESRLSMLPDVVESTATSPHFVHPFEFGVLAVLAFRLLAFYSRISRRFVLLGSLIFAIAYGFSDEFHQSFVSGRESSLLDVGLDSLGAMIGLVTVEAAIRLGKRLKNMRGGLLSS